MSPLNIYILQHKGGKFYPYFKDFVGALDDTYIGAIVNVGEQVVYWSRRDLKNCSQNVLGVCDFNMCFTFVLAGLEGTTHDYRVLNHALSNQAHNFPLSPYG